MDAMQRYAELLLSLELYVQVHIMTGVKMKSKRLKFAKFIFTQAKKAGFLLFSKVFDVNMVEITNTEDDKEYYGAFLFVPNIASVACSRLQKTCSPDAGHFQEIGTQSYGTTYELVIYDTNRHLFPLCFAHYVASECAET